MNILGQLLQIFSRASMLYESSKRANEDVQWLQKQGFSNFLSRTIADKREGEYMWYLVGIADAYWLDGDELLRMVESGNWRLPHLLRRLKVA